MGQLARFRKAQAERRSEREVPVVAGTKAKRARIAVVVPEERERIDEMGLEADVLAQAKELNCEAALRNLAARPEMLQGLVSSRRMLEALKECGGLVNKAKHTLLAEKPSL